MIEIKVAIFEDNKQLRESLKELINTAENMVCIGSFPDAGKLVRNIEFAKPDPMFTIHYFGRVFQDQY